MAGIRDCTDPVTMVGIPLGITVGTAPGTIVGMIPGILLITDHIGVIVAGHTTATDITTLDNITGKADALPEGTPPGPTDMPEVTDIREVDAQFAVRTDTQQGAGDPLRQPEAPPLVPEMVITPIHRHVPAPIHPVPNTALPGRVRIQPGLSVR